MIDIEKYLNNFFKGTKNPSLNAMYFFMNEYNNFEKEMKFIHIAGTNGKGSCLEIITNILICQGYKVGKFLSPHLIEYNERISINNILITDEELSNLIIELEPKIQKYKKLTGKNITLFELETIMGLLYFYRNNVDFVVLETGLGGLYDCTNIITKPLVSIISSISYDHMHILGNSLEEIAIQKAGIIKENSNTIIFEQENFINSVFINTCKEKNNNLHLLKNSDITNYSFDENFQYIDYKNLKNIAIVLKGKKQIKNSAICIECINILNSLGYTISENSIRKGLKTVIHKGRFEILNKNPEIIFDGAHNEDSIKNLQETIKTFYKNKKRTYIISILKTKDYKKILDLLFEDKNATFIFTSGNNSEKYNNKNVLYEYASEIKTTQTILSKELNEAIDYVLQEKNFNNINFITGSFYIYGDVINYINNKKM